jgi:hypothetical protein
LATEVLTGWRYVHGRMAEVIHDSHGAFHLPQADRTYIRLYYP